MQYLQRHKAIAQWAVYIDVKSVACRLKFELFFQQHTAQSEFIHQLTHQAECVDDVIVLAGREGQ